MSTAQSSHCVVPRYKEGYLVHSSAADIGMAVSIDVGDLTPSRIACLAGALKERFRERKSITVFIFTSADAAENYRLHESDDAAHSGAFSGLGYELCGDDWWQPVSEWNLGWRRVGR